MVTPKKKQVSYNDSRKCKKLTDFMEEEDERETKREN